MSGRRKAIKVLAIFIGGAFIVAILLGLVVGFVDPTVMVNELTLSQFLWTMVLQNIFLILLLVVSLIVFVGKKNWGSFLVERRKRKGWKPFWQYVIGPWLGYLIAMMIIGTILSAFNVEIPGFNGEQGVITLFEGFNLLYRRQYGLIFLFVAIVTPLIEEMIYRTFLTELLSRHGNVFGVVAAALIFALSHVEGGVFLNLFILGLILGYIYHKTKSGWYPFFFHLIINSISLLVLFL